MLSAKQAEETARSKKNNINPFLLYET